VTIGFRQDLDRNVAPQALVARTIHLAHASGTQEPEDLERTNPGADSECQR
jgi:hypothetical protein